MRSTESAPAQFPTEALSTPVSPFRDALKSKIRNTAIRGTLTVVAAIAPVIAYDSAAASPGQSSTTHKDNGPKCVEVFVGSTSYDNQTYANATGGIRAYTGSISLENNSTSAYVDVGTLPEGSIYLDCNLSQADTQSPSTK